LLTCVGKTSPTATLRLLDSQIESVTSVQSQQHVCSDVQVHARLSPVGVRPTRRAGSVDEPVTVFPARFALVLSVDNSSDDRAPFRCRVSARLRLEVSYAGRSAARSVTINCVCMLGIGILSHGAHN
jgi:hypothetical protein